MRLLLVPLIVLSLLLAGCGQVFVGFVSNPGGTMHVSGTVSTVQLDIPQRRSWHLDQLHCGHLRQCWNCHHH